MRSFKTEGIIIKRRNLGESDKIVTIFTSRHGKLNVKATGVRKITSRRAAHIEPLNFSLLTLHTGRNYPILTEAQGINTYSSIKNDLTKVGLAYHICELIDGLCPENEAHEEIFHLLKNTLSKLSHNDNNITIQQYNNDFLSIIHEFEVELLTLLGYWRSNHQSSVDLDTNTFIESIIERRLKSKRIFSKL